MSSGAVHLDTTLAHEKYKQRLQGVLLGAAHSLPRRMPQCKSDASSDALNPHVLTYDTDKVSQSHVLQRVRRPRPPARSGIDSQRSRRLSSDRQRAAAAAAAAIVAGSVATGATAAELSSSSACVKRSASGAVLGVDLFECSNESESNAQLYNFGTVSPRILRFSAKSTAAARGAKRRRQLLSSSLMLDNNDASLLDERAQSLAGAAKKRSLLNTDNIPNEKSSSSSGGGSLCASEVDAQQEQRVSDLHRHAASVFRVPTNIARRGSRRSRQSASRAVPKRAVRSHDAPGVGTDFYLQLMASSNARDALAIALNERVYMMKWHSNETELLTAPRGVVGSIAFAEGASTLLSVGTNMGVQVLDTHSKRLVRRMSVVETIESSRRTHASMAWHGCNLVAVGRADHVTAVYDVRVPSDAPMLALTRNRGLICGVAFSSEGRLAAGANVGDIDVWDCRQPAAPIGSFNSGSGAAVKALAWHPETRNVLASGGGSADRKLRLWNIDARRCFNWRDTRAQVTGVVWSVQNNELITSHGYSDDGTLAMWTAPELLRVARMHRLPKRERSLYMVGSYDGSMVATADTLERVRFWQVNSRAARGDSGAADNGDDVSDEENSDNSSTSSTTTRTERLFRRLARTQRTATSKFQEFTVR